jgi:hypothetical protein
MPDLLLDGQDRVLAKAALREAVDPGAVLRTFVDEEIQLAAERARVFPHRAYQRLPWDNGQYPEITAAVTSDDWEQVVEIGMAAADPLARMIIVGKDLPDARSGNGPTFRGKRIEDAVAALERVVSAHGDTVPRWVLQAGAMVSDFWVPTGSTDMDAYPVTGRLVDASNLRRLCLETYFSPH